MKYININLKFIHKHLKEINAIEINCWVIHTIQKFAKGSLKVHILLEVIKIKKPWQQICGDDSNVKTYFYCSGK